MVLLDVELSLIHEDFERSLILVLEEYARIHSCHYIINARLEEPDVPVGIDEHSLEEGHILDCTIVVLQISYFNLNLARFLIQDLLQLDQVLMSSMQWILDHFGVSELVYEFLAFCYKRS